MSQTKGAYRKELTNIAERLLEPSISFDKSQKLYKEWNTQGTYDKMLGDPKEYSALAQMRAATEKYVKDRQNALFLDVGAGTGLSGQMLQNLGCKNIHALEPLQEFADQAKKKGIYSHMLIETIGFGQTSAKTDTYDAVVSSGAFGPGHIPCDAVDEMIRIVKPGGYVIICMRLEYTWTVPEYRGKLEPRMKALEEKGKWRQILREIYPNHFLSLDGLLLVYQVS